MGITAVLKENLTPTRNFLLFFFIADKLNTMGETSLQLQPDGVFVGGGGIENQLRTWAGVLKPPSHPECLVAEDILRLRLASHFPESGCGE